MIRLRIASAAVTKETFLRMMYDIPDATYRCTAPHYGQFSEKAVHTKDIQIKNMNVRNQHVKYQGRGVSR
jgi:hypothetical protein